jgi:hypothetical protein
MNNSANIKWNEQATSLAALKQVERIVVDHAAFAPCQSSA